jgi:hypothetical protein
MTSNVPIGGARGSAPKNHAPKSAQGESEVDAPYRRHGSELRPNNRKIGAAIKDGLRECHEMRGRTDNPHHVLQPNGHALHWRGAAGQKLHDEEDGSREQCELAHGGRDRAEQDAKSCNR